MPDSHTKDRAPILHFLMEYFNEAEMLRLNFGIGFIKSIEADTMASKETKHSYFSYLTFCLASLCLNMPYARSQNHLGRVWFVGECSLARIWEPGSRRTGCGDTSYCCLVVCMYRTRLRRDNVCLPAWSHIAWNKNKKTSNLIIFNLCIWTLVASPYFTFHILIYIKIH